MGQLTWKPEYELGIAEVDHEHRELVSLIDEICASLRSADADEATRLLGQLHAQIAAHFALEEKMMRLRDYDRYAVHKADHERLLDLLRDLMDDYDDGYAGNVDQFVELLENWFSGHFANEDAQLHRML